MKPSKPEPNKTATSGAAPADPAGKPLDPNAILVAEFEYIAQSLFHTNDDRAGSPASTWSPWAASSRRC